MNREGIIPCSLPLSYSHQAKSVRETSFVSEDALHALFSSGNTSSLLLDLWATGRWRPHGASPHSWVSCLRLLSWGVPWTLGSVNLISPKHFPSFCHFPSWCYQIIVAAVMTAESVSFGWGDRSCLNLKEKQILGIIHAVTEEISAIRSSLIPVPSVILNWHGGLVRERSPSRSQEDRGL